MLGGRVMCRFLLLTLLPEGLGSVGDGLSATGASRRLVRRAMLLKGISGVGEEVTRFLLVEEDCPLGSDAGLENGRLMMTLGCVTGSAALSCVLWIVPPSLCWPLSVRPMRNFVTSSAISGTSISAMALSSRCSDSSRSPFRPSLFATSQRCPS